MRKVISIRLVGRAKDKPVYEVTLDDGTVATSLREYSIGELAQGWYDHKYQKVKLKPMP